MEKVVTVSKSFDESDRADKAYYQRLSPRARLGILLELNRRWSSSADAGPTQRLERVYRIIKLP
jgi:hypothetical protein